MAEISTWDELLSTATDETAEIVWMGGDLDFNEIQPHGFTETITFKAKSIDFQNATFKNIRSYANMAFSFNCSAIKNLSITDMIFMPESTNTNNYLLSFSGQTEAHNLVITAEIESSGRVYISHDNSKSQVRLYSCGFNIRARSQSAAVYFIGNSTDFSTYLRFIDCRFILDIEQKGEELFDNCIIMNSLISGRFKNIDETAVSLTSSNLTGTNVYNLEGNFTYTSPKLSVYNSDLATFEPNDNIIACTAEELKNPEILRKKGFPIAVNSND